jgi:hypothetical protein
MTGAGEGQQQYVYPTRPTDYLYKRESRLMWPKHFRFRVRICEEFEPENENVYVTSNAIL